jgi:DNA-binding MarR family transcriptional regulator
MTMAKSAAIEGKRRNKLTKLIRGLEPLQKELSLPQLLTLLQIAVSPGLSVNDLAEKLGIPQQTASRHVSALLGRYQGTPAGSDLTERSTLDPLIVQEINQNDPRSRALFVSEQGDVFLEKLVSQIDL